MCYKNAAPPELQECRSSGAKGRNNMCYKNVDPPELKGNSTILY
jgi:hypothetical protein